MAPADHGRVATPVDAEHRAIGPYIHDTGEEWPFAAFERPRKLRVLDLFSGIGGFSLGLERTGGFETVAFCEIEAFPRKVLAKHWPDVPCYHDVRELTAERLAADGIAVDAICGGFPCQDISSAGKQAGIDANTRSGLWGEIVRLAGEIRPGFLIVENVAALLSGPSERPGGWFGRVLGDLASLGYDAQWHCIPASHLGAYHQRDRVWIVAHTNAHSLRFQGVWGAAGKPWAKEQFARLVQVALQSAISTRSGGGIHDGVPDRAHRLKALGNAVVPQIPELIGNAILAARTPYRPADFNDWRDGILEGLAASAGVLGSFHTPDNN